jgi:serine/threonine protein kinase
VRLRDIAAGMAYLHSRNVLHGDLKAANVLLASSPTAPFGMVGKVRGEGARGWQGPGAVEVTWGRGLRLPHPLSLLAAYAFGQPPSAPPRPPTLAKAASAFPHPLAPSPTPSRLTPPPRAFRRPPRLQVADFGLSRMLKVGQTHRSTRTVGTVGWGRAQGRGGRHAVHAELAAWSWSVVGAARRFLHQNESLEAFHPGGKRGRLALCEQAQARIK